MPTNDDETLHKRYEKEHHTVLSMLKNRTPEQMFMDDLLRHNAEAELITMKEQLDRANTRANIISQNLMFERKLHEETTKLLVEAHEWIDDCRTRILYPLAHQQTELGMLAEGFGQCVPEILKVVKLPGQINK